MLLKGTNILSGIPGFNCSQYSASSLLNISTHFLAASYHSLILLIWVNFTAARSSLFHLTCIKSPVSGSWFSTGNECIG